MVRRARAVVGWLGWGVVTLTAATALAQAPPERQAFFGQTHVHTSWSFDAYIFGNHVTGPEDAYKYAMGQAINHPAGYEMKITRPLDFQGVTDHSEYVGTIRLANDPSSAISKLPIAEKLKVRSTGRHPARSSCFCRQPRQARADQGADRPRKSRAPSGSRTSRLPTSTTSPASSRRSPPTSGPRRRTTGTCTATSSSRTARRCRRCRSPPSIRIHPEDLWTWMDGQRKAGNELLAISHNANLSDGIMFPLEVDYKGRPIDAAWAQQRVNNEPLHRDHTRSRARRRRTPLLSPNDEFANFEIMSFLLGADNSTSQAPRQLHPRGLAERPGDAADARLQPVQVGRRRRERLAQHGVSYTACELLRRARGHRRHAEGAPERPGRGRHGGAEDQHRRASAACGPRRTRASRSSPPCSARKPSAPAACASRCGCSAAGTSSQTCSKQKDWVKIGYAKGVPMGGDLPAPTGKAPTFIVWAVKDPEDANLDRIQIVKGWTKNGQIFEKIYDVAWSGEPQARSGRPARCRRSATRWISRTPPTRTPSARWN